jgi:hypothetical protein
VVEVDAGAAMGFLQHHIALPAEVATALVATGCPRFVGEIVGIETDGELVAFRRVLHRRADGVYCLRFGRQWLHDAGLKPDARVAVSLRPDPTPDAIDIPDELEAALAGSGPASQQWKRLTPGRQRSFAYGIERVKSPDARARRAEALVERLAEDFESGSKTEMVKKRG